MGLQQQLLRVYGAQHTQQGRGRVEQGPSQAEVNRLLEHATGVYDQQTQLYLQQLDEGLISMEAFAVLRPEFFE